MNKKAVAGIAAVVVASSVALSRCSAQEASAECFAGRPEVELASGAPQRPETTKPTAFDASEAIFNNPDPTKAYGFKLDRDNTTGRDCIVGGTFVSGGSDELDFDTWHNHNALIIQESDTKTIGATFSNVGDAISYNGGSNGWELISIFVDGAGGIVHDDCVENDAGQAGKITQSLFDGCNTFLSSRGLSMMGYGNTVEVSDTFVRLAPFRNSYKPERYGENQHGGFFKWSDGTVEQGVAPDLVVKDSVFRSDTPAAYGGYRNTQLGLPAGSECENVTLIGTESWPDRDLATWTSQCEDLKLGTIADWDRLVADWKK